MPQAARWATKKVTAKEENWTDFALRITAFYAEYRQLELAHYISRKWDAQEQSQLPSPPPVSLDEPRVAG